MELSPEELAGFFDTVLPHLNELQTRVVAGAIAEALGHGGQARVVEASGMSSSTVYKSVAEVRAGVEPLIVNAPLAAGTNRRSTSSPACSKHSTSWSIPPRAARRCRRCAGHSNRPTSWPKTSRPRGFRASAELVRRLLHQMGYSLQAPAKAERGHVTPRPRRPVRLHQQAGGVPPQAGRAGHQRGHEEEGADRQLRQRRERVATGR